MSSLVRIWVVVLFFNGYNKVLCSLHYYYLIQRLIIIIQANTLYVLTPVSTYMYTHICIYKRHVSGYFSRTWFKCNFTVVKTPLCCTRKWSCKMTCTSAMSQLQLPCNGSTGQVPSWNTKLAQGTHRTCTRCGKFRVPGGDLISWTVARKLQLAYCWRAGHLAASFPGTIQLGFYHREDELKKRRGKKAKVISVSMCVHTRVSIHTWLNSNTSLKFYSWVFVCVCAVRICTCLSVFVFTLRVTTSIFCLPAGFFTQEGSIGFALGASQGFNPAPDSCKNTHRTHTIKHFHIQIHALVHTCIHWQWHLHAHTRTHAQTSHTRTTGTCWEINRKTAAAPWYRFKLDRNYSANIKMAFFTSHAFLYLLRVESSYHLQINVRKHFRESSRYRAPNFPWSATHTALSIHLAEC